MKTRKHFLLQLKYNMACHFSLKEIQNTIEDFNGFFEEGIRDGKTEEELCLSFGEPKEIVRQIASKKRGLSLHMIFALAAAAICAACIWVMAMPIPFQDTPTAFFCIPVFAAAITLLLIEGGILFSIAAPSAVSFRKTIPLRLCPLALAGCLALFSLKGLPWIIHVAAPPAAGRTAGNICQFFLLCGGSLFLCGAYSFFRGNPFSFSAAVQGMGILCSSCAALDLLHRLDTLPLSTAPVLIPCGCSILLSLFYDAALLYQRHPKKNHADL